MKRLTILLLIASVAVLSEAQITMRGLIIAMPDSILPLLTQVNREDCVDFLEAGMKARVTNRFDATSELTTLTSDYACWQYTAGSVYEMKLLPLSDTLQVLCMTHRLLSPVCDASVRFYDGQWTPLSAERFVAPPAAVENTSLLTTRDYVLSPNSTELTVITRTENIGAETAEGEEQSVIPREERTLYVWKDGRYVRKEAE